MFNTPSCLVVLDAAGLKFADISAVPYDRPYSRLRPPNLDP
jgi:hypothetical protein